MRGKILTWSRCRGLEDRRKVHTSVNQGSSWTTSKRNEGYQRSRYKPFKVDRLNSRSWAKDKEHDVAVAKEGGVVLRLREGKPASGLGHFLKGKNRQYTLAG